MKTALLDFRTVAGNVVSDLQDRICEAASALETGACFAVDDWETPVSGNALHGRGSTRIISDGAVFERGGVNTSFVVGNTLPGSLLAQRPELAGHGFFAAGVSVVFHPRNPYAPTGHCNFRYFEAANRNGDVDAWWFGGGADLTPFYPRLEDVRQFHAGLRAACDRCDLSFYPAFKTWCDRYFFLKHRNESRGVGGIFYDYLDAGGFGEPAHRTSFAAQRPFGDFVDFMREAGAAFADSYLAIVEKRSYCDYGERERAFQLLRRGRYVEFNLLYDRGTLFGLQSGGRTEAILMSLPPLARWASGGSDSDTVALRAYLQPREWFSEDPFA